MKICHVTSTHKAEDQRIFHKECVSLVKNGYDVYIVAQGDDHVSKGVTFLGTGEEKSSSRYRLLKRPKVVYRLALGLGADIYHLHDMELLPYALKLKKHGKRVIFDYHEDFASRFADSDVFHLPKVLMKLLAWVYKHYEIYVFKELDALISVTPHICDRLRKTNLNTYMVTNYPLINETWGRLTDNSCAEKYIVFAGQVSSKMYCLDTAVKAMQDIDDVSLRIYGPERRAGDIEELKSIDRRGIMYYGKIVPFDDIPKILSGAVAILVTCAYTKDTNEKMGTLGNNKLFEAMLQGVPVICSDFDLWRDIVEKNRCGICVEPGNTNELKKAISAIIENEGEAKEMGKRGRKAVHETYNWKSQEEVLYKLYASILQNT